MSKDSSPSPSGRHFDQNYPDDIDMHQSDSAPESHSSHLKLKRKLSELQMRKSLY
jgi:hypothetical protein